MHRLAPFLLPPLVLLSAAAHLLIGPVTLDALWSGDPLAWRILLELRLPRLLQAAATGALLGWAGTVMQTLFRNPLADPGLIGVSAGAALSAVLLIALGLAGLHTQMAAATVGALLTLIFLYRLATRQGETRLSWLLLAGIAFNATASAGIGLSLHLADDQQLRLMTGWLMGSFAQASGPTGLILLSVLVLLGILSPRLVPALDRLLLGERAAFLMGEPVERLKRILLLTSALAVGLPVAASGMISFVGLAAPHIARLLVGNLHRRLLPAAMQTGMILTLTADLAARTLAAPGELPVGLLLAALGGPFFFYLLMRLPHAAR